MDRQMWLKSLKVGDMITILPNDDNHMFSGNRRVTRVTSTKIICWIHQFRRKDGTGMQKSIYRIVEPEKMAAEGVYAAKDKVKPEPEKIANKIKLAKFIITQNIGEMNDYCLLKLANRIVDSKENNNE